ncbi:conserved hypothetical protein [Pediculus humanus corporis]|uniref:G-patch domain-containing protein n=1 Tax=Pediculus humanus subsp. corporis TaxID=121224 RepID=E0VQ53_PEDHC|nr:uncharacterized protein Phum_PHUM372050 [Pediculus humanus corporis]EEB15509.1 conserved hypothetical protein [Pediculus humanus corporis]
MSHYYYHFGLKQKVFVKEVENCEDASLKLTELSHSDGEKTKELYENLSNPINETTKDNDLLLMAQNNDIKGLKLFFSMKSNINPNIKDDFGWTPLMCACCSGAEDAVRLLLQKGADPFVKDKTGNSAIKIATLKKYDSIVSLISNFSRNNNISHNNNSNKSDTNLKNKKESVPRYFCDSCNQEFLTSKEKHESSTVHLFNSNHKKPVHYVIPESNKGFQILLKKGWNKEKGLGPEGNGILFPIKAIVKKNRHGIGVPNNKRNIKKLPLINYENKNKTEILNRELKEKHFEKNFRREFL